MANVYNKAREIVGDKTLTWQSDTINCMLMTGVPVFDQTDANATAVLASGGAECTRASYSRQSAGGKGDAINGNNYEYTCGNITFSSLEVGETIVAAVVMKWVDGAGADLPLSMHDTNDLPTNGSDIVFNPASGVVFTLNP